MNLLVSALREHTGGLADLDPSEDAPYRTVAEVAAGNRDLARLLRAVDVDPLISDALSQTFAGVVLLEDWNNARETGLAEFAQPDAPNEWVTIIRIPGRRFGVTLPEDRLPDQRVSLFTRTDQTIRRVSVVVIPDQRPRLELRMAGGECGFPYRGVCSGGTCTNCQHQWMAPPGQPAGYACRCDDPEPDQLAVSAARADTSLHARGTRLTKPEPDYA